MEENSFSSNKRDHIRVSSQQGNSFIDAHMAPSKRSSVASSINKRHSAMNSQCPLDGCIMEVEP